MTLRVVLGPLEWIELREASAARRCQPIVEEVSKVVKQGDHDRPPVCLLVHPSWPRTGQIVRNGQTTSIRRAVTVPGAGLS